MNVRAAIHQGQSSAGVARHVVPFRQRQMIASTVRRRFDDRALARGRQASTSRAGAAHCSSVGAMPHPSAQQAEAGTHCSDANRA